MEIIARQRNPYFFHGPTQIGFSGGRSSGFMLARIIEAHHGVLPDYIHPLFMNTGKEREETLIFIDECAKRWGVNIQWLEYTREWMQEADKLHWRQIDFGSASRKGEPFEKMLDYYKKYRAEKKNLGPILPNPTNRMCTAYLKIKISESYMRNHCGYSHWDQVVGIRYDEPRRYHRLMQANELRKNTYDNICPMYEEKIIQQDVQAFWKKQPFDLGIDSDLGNCDLCFLKHENKLMRALQSDPSMANWWSELEESTGQFFRRDRPNYRQLKWYAQNMSKQLSVDFGDDLFDCMCGE